MRVAVFGGVLVAMTGGSFGQDWPQWRGPGRDGVAAGVPARTSWPREPSRVWKVTVGTGYASPVVAGSSLYVFTREAAEEVLSRLDLATGRRLWRQGYPAPYDLNPAAAGHGKGPKSTPVVDGGRVFTFGISGTLSAFDAETGRVLWRKEFGKEFRATSPVYGVAMSPAVASGLLIAHVGGYDDGSLQAFDAATGLVKWAWKGDGPGYASPVVVELAGVRQVVTLTQSHVVGLSLDRGELLWKIPFHTEYDQNAVTPVVHGANVIYSGLGKGITAVRILKPASGWTAEKLWENTEVSLYLSSPVLDGERLCGFSHRQKGQMFCLDTRSGRTLWTSPPRQGENAAILVAAGAVLFLTNDAKLHVARSGAAAFEPLATYTLSESPTWAHPVVLRNGVLVKDAETLAFWWLE